MHVLLQLALAVPAFSISGSASDTASGSEEETVVPTDWLVLPPVDARGRRPFNPNVAFARHLLDPDSPPPKEGEALTGELGVEKKWEKRSADESGSVRGGSAQMAFTTVEWPEVGVALADLDGASIVWVNGVPQVGDPYGDGMGGLPVAMKKGTNAVYVSGMRGGFRLALSKPQATLILNPFDATLPDWLIGSPTSVDASLVLLNASNEWFDEVILESEEPPNGIGMRLVGPSRPRTLGPRATTKFRLELMPTPELLQAKQVPAKLTVTVRAKAGTQSASTTFEIATKSPHELRCCTYTSEVDGSVQRYALLPPSRPDADRLVLTLHGAGVDCMGQAAAYSQKPDFWIVAPTNRRRFGFDWQDWGRRDAYDVLEKAIEQTKANPRRVYLTGHSMGGHGVWHLAANDPFTFAAIAPSAGWSSFDSYGGGRPAGALSDLWRGADGPSRTLDLLDNLKQVPTFVLHGTADDNVPVREARLMIDALTQAGAPPSFHLEEGAGHWWDGDKATGADCVDWPELFDFFREHEAPARSHDVDFTYFVSTVRPRHLQSSRTRRASPAPLAAALDGVAGRWILDQPERYGEPMRIRARFDPESRVMNVETTNVRRFAIQWPKKDPIPARLDIDGDTLTSDVLESAVTRFWPLRSGAMVDALALLRTDGHWTAMPPTDWRAGKGRSGVEGPFKRVFDDEFVLVYGTHGTPDENRELYERARYDATLWWYRANGIVKLISDDRFCDYVQPEQPVSDARFPWNALLYGNAQTNAAIPLVGAFPSAAITVRRGAIEAWTSQSARQAPVKREWKGDECGALFWFRGRDDHLFGVMGDTGIRGTRLGYTLPYFTSGVGYPDYAVFSSDVLSKGDGGVLAAGWFAHDWSLPESLPATK